MRLRILPVIVGSLLIIGAGCAATQPPAENTTDTGVKGDTDTSTTGTDTENTNSEITLTGSITGPNSVKLEWEPSSEVVDSVEKWWLIGGSEENPSYPGTKFVFERGKGFREKEWKGLGSGATHFRVCAVVNNKCSVYSNDLTLEIPGRVPGTK